jgi:hypothetical protein
MTKSRRKAAFVFKNKWRVAPLLHPGFLSLACLYTRAKKRNLPWVSHPQVNFLFDNHA